MAEEEKMFFFLDLEIGFRLGRGARQGMGDMWNGRMMTVV